MTNVYLNNDRSGYYNNNYNYNDYGSYNTVGNSYMNVSNNNTNSFANSFNYDSQYDNIETGKNSSVGCLNAMLSSLSGFWTSKMSALTTNGSKFLGRIALPVGVLIDIARDWTSIKSAYDKDLSNRDLLFPNTIKASAIPVGSALAGGFAGLAGGFLCSRRGPKAAMACGIPASIYGYNTVHDYLSNINW